MRVYADVFFLLNAAADYALLAAAGRLVGVRARAGRLAAGACLGACYGLAALLVPDPGLFSLPAAAGVAAVMAAAAYAPRPPRVFLRLLACLWGSAALAAGLALGLAGGAAAGVPWWGLLLALGGTLAAAAVLRERWKPGAPLGALCALEIEIVGHSASCRALIDTGTSLADPCGDGPAVVVHAPVLRGLVPAPLLRAMADGPAALPAAAWPAAAWLAPGAAEASAAAEPGQRTDAASWDLWAPRIRLLPYRSVGRGAGLLCGLRPDRVWVGDGPRRRPVRAVLAVSPTPLDPGGAFAALVPAALAADPEGAG